MLWYEDALKHAMHLDPCSFFGRKVQIIDLDTKITKGVRVDVVLVDSERQLIACEFERKLDTQNIRHVLIEQAWKAAKRYYWNASVENLEAQYRIYHQTYQNPFGEPT